MSFKYENDLASLALKTRAIKHFSTLYSLIFFSFFSLHAQNNPPSKEIKEYVDSLTELKKETDEFRLADEKSQKEGLDVAGRDPEIVEVAKEVEPYALMSHATYSFKADPIPGYKRLSKSELPQKWQKHYVEKNSSIQLKNIAMGAIVFKKEHSDQLVLAYKGTDLRLFLAPSFSKLLENWSNFQNNFLTATQLKLGWTPQHFTQALELANDLKEKYNDHTLLFTGSSLGGAIAQFVALKTTSQAYVFNSLALNTNQINEIKKSFSDPEHFNKAKKLITIVSLAGDSVSDLSRYIPYFGNTYHGREFKLPFYSNSFSGYYLNLHHTTDALLKSIETIIKKSTEVQGQCIVVQNDKSCQEEKISRCFVSKEAQSCYDFGCVWNDEEKMCQAH